MATDSGQKFIRRNRAPRVHITYEDPYDAERLIELPFVMGVMSDLSGNNSAVEKPKVEERKFLEFDMDNFDNRMAAIEPGVTMRVDNKLGDEPRREAVGQSAASRRWTTSARPRSRARCRRSPSCWRRASSSPTCCATWTARWPPKTSSRSCLTDPQLMAALQRARAAASQPTATPSREAISAGDQIMAKQAEPQAKLRRTPRRAKPTSSRRC